MFFFFFCTTFQIVDVHTYIVWIWMISFQHTNMPSSHSTFFFLCWCMHALLKLRQMKMLKSHTDITRQHSSWAANLIESIHYFYVNNLSVYRSWCWKPKNLYFCEVQTLWIKPGGRLMGILMITYSHLYTIGRSMNTLLSAILVRQCI